MNYDSLDTSIAMPKVKRVATAGAAFGKMGADPNQPQVQVVPVGQ